VEAALTRYRVIAYVVGVALLALTAAVVVQVTAHDETMVKIIGPIHGFLYMVYLVLAYDLARRVGWPIGRTVLVLLAGTIPFLTFVAEHRVTRELRGRAAIPSTGPSAGRPG
jgi:integral membrane protein